ncbi:flagellar protein [Sulfitobacter sp. M220]|jgi:flagellin|uniref:flagellin N-terminal helical domain-containing protein n=1 Tax=Sulfitobacter TaxID=60136 RepID=UPI001B63E046|nr:MULTISPECIES: flagellin [unclassified Sulfitobacter]MBQ0717998.1 flagellar protein [Sulfitobacter litoralis]MBQ0800492.1 flagellar protein [Sulfitobacter litoralis]MCF7728195.1 flagellar protein [Sulfitobacter sp. M22]MCF7779183.1 flagellar protein [Sulfitobacter sp. M220]
MSSILTNSSAMNALATLKDVNRGLNQTQDRVSTGLKVASGKDNAAYFAVSETMKGDSGMFKAINEGMSATKNSVATARLGAETVSDIAQQIVERVAFAQTDGVDRADVQLEIDALVKNMGTAIEQATFNGDNLVDGTKMDDGTTDNSITLVNGVKRDGSTFATTTFNFEGVNLGAIKTAFESVKVYSETTPGTPDDIDMSAALSAAETQLAASITAATSLGITENALEGQMEFIDSLTDTLDSGVSSMVDADMEEEAARLQAYQVQQQLATQSLSIANQAPQNILSLFR